MAPGRCDRTHYSRDGGFLSAPTECCYQDPLSTGICLSIDGFRLTHSGHAWLLGCGSAVGVCAVANFSSPFTYFFLFFPSTTGRCLATTDLSIGCSALASRPCRKALAWAAARFPSRGERPHRGSTAADPGRPVWGPLSSRVISRPDGLRPVQAGVGCPLRDPGRYLASWDTAGGALRASAISSPCGSSLAANGGHNQISMGVPPD